MKNIVSSVLSCKCPRCREGNMFKYTLFERPYKFMEMNKVCPVCNLNLAQEEGYYYGAMFVSYGFSIIELVAVLLGVKLFSKNPLSIEMIMTVLISVYLLLAPLNFRWGRAGWISMFFKYNKKSGKVSL